MNLINILNNCKVNLELTVTLSKDKYEIGNVNFVSYASIGVEPCSKKSWRHDHSKSVTLNITEPRKCDKDQAP